LFGVPQYNPNAIRDFRSRMMLKVHDKDLPEGTCPTNPRFPFPLPCPALPCPALPLAWTPSFDETLPHPCSTHLLTLHYHRPPAIDKLIAKSYNHSGTNLYDSFQLATNGIAK